MFPRLTKAVTVFWLSLALLLGGAPLTAGKAAAACESEPAPTTCGCSDKCGCCVKPHEAPAAPVAPALPAPAQHELAWAMPIPAGALTLPTPVEKTLSSPAAAAPHAAPVPIFQRDCSYLI